MTALSVYLYEISSTVCHSYLRFEIYLWMKWQLKRFKSIDNDLNFKVDTQVANYNTQWRWKLLTPQAWMKHFFFKKKNKKETYARCFLHQQQKSECNYFTGLRASSKLWNLNILIFNTVDSFFSVFAAAVVVLAVVAEMNIKYVWQTHFPIPAKSVRCEKKSLQWFRLLFSFFLTNGFLQTICYHRQKIIPQKLE